MPMVMLLYGQRARLHYSGGGASNKKGSTIRPSCRGATRMKSLEFENETLHSRQKDQRLSPKFVKFSSFFFFVFKHIHLGAKTSQ